MKIRYIIFLFTVLAISGCGSLTKMRYSRGFKSEFSFFAGKESPAKEEQKAVVAKKYKTGRHNPVIDTMHPTPVVWTPITETCSSGNKKPLLHKFSSKKAVTNKRAETGLAKSIKTDWLLHKKSGENDNFRPWVLLASFLTIAGVVLIMLYMLESLAEIWLTLGFILLFSGMALALIVTVIYLINGGWSDWIQSIRDNAISRILSAIVFAIILGIISLFL